VLKYLLFAMLSVLPLAQAVNAAQIIVGNLGFEKIPADQDRRVVGTWLLKKLACTRSIEAVGDRYFMVSRCKGKKADGTGLPIRKMSAALYEGQTTSWSYEIAANGSLIMRSRRGVELIGEPHAGLWP
jgi:hypothetical protein